MLKVLTEQHEEKKGRYLSWSATKDWKTCPFYYKLTKIDEVEGFAGNIHTAFGNGAHWTAEQFLGSEHETPSDLSEAFSQNFEKAISELPDEEQKLITEDSKTKKLYNEMQQQGRELVHHMVPALDDYFGSWSLVGIEEKFYEKCDFYDKSDFFFKGFIDLVLKTEDGKYHIVDWKTCSWGWDAKKKSDPMVTYQLTVYKYFFCKKYGIDPKNVETHFALCKRTNKSDKRVEIFRVTSGPRKTDNALNLLKQAVYNVDNGKLFIKNRLSCKRCKFRRTKHCP